MTENELRVKLFDLHAQLPKWHRLVNEELRISVLLQALKDASIVNFPPHIRSMINQIEFHIETHRGKEPK